MCFVLTSLPLSFAPLFLFDVPFFLFLFGVSPPFISLHSLYFLASLVFSLSTFPLFLATPVFYSLHSILHVYKRLHLSSVLHRHKSNPISRLSKHSCTHSACYTVRVVVSTITRATTGTNYLAKPSLKSQGFIKDALRNACKTCPIPTNL